MTFKDAIVNMINNGMLDWELVGLEMLNRMKINEVKNMIFENHWEDEICIELCNKQKKGETNMKMFIITAVDTSDKSDGKARVLAQRTTIDEAKNFVKQDMENFINDAAGMNPIADFDKMSVHTKDGMYGCEWNIEEIDVVLPTRNC